MKNVARWMEARSCASRCAIFWVASSAVHVSRLIRFLLAVSAVCIETCWRRRRSAGWAGCKAETPDEFAARLAGAVGDGAERTDVATLTDAYDTARYGEREPERGEVDTLRDASQRLTRKIAAP